MVPKNKEPGDGEKPKDALRRLADEFAAGASGAAYLDGRISEKQKEIDALFARMGGLKRQFLAEWPNELSLWYTNTSKEWGRGDPDADAALDGGRRAELRGKVRSLADDAAKTAQNPLDSEKLWWHGEGRKAWEAARSGGVLPPDRTMGESLDRLVELFREYGFQTVTWRERTRKGLDSTHRFWTEGMKQSFSAYESLIQQVTSKEQEIARLKAERDAEQASDNWR